MINLVNLHSKLARVAALGLVAASLVAPTMAFATTGSEPRDADRGSIMYNGAYSKSEWTEKVDLGDGLNSSAMIQQVYFNEGRGITRANFLSADTVDGTVYKDGHVVVNGQTVATNGMTVSRVPSPGSVQSGSVFEGTTASIFIADSIPAFVNMQDGTFHYAVIKSCGNPVRATAVVKPTPTPMATPTPKPTATPVPTKLPTPTPVATPAPTPKVLGVTTTLPDTGAESAFGGVAGVTALGYATRSYLRSRKSVADALRGKNQSK
ncbi:MAG: hypothetical protein NVSMB39_1400 [Candidatus Saccharimonadales bacterium]